MGLSDHLKDFQTDRIFIITGAPASGKTTYARTHRKDGDIVIDLDYIAASLKLETSPHGGREDVLDTAWYIRQKIIEAIQNHEITYSRAFIISTKMKEAKKLRELLGGTIINVDRGIEETLRHIEQDTEMTEAERKHRKDLALGYYYKGDDRG